MPKELKFNPDYAVAPGTTLREVLEERGIGQSDLAIRTGLAEKTVSQIINGVAPLSCETAGKLELALGVPARFWNTRELHYREGLLKIAEDKRLSEDTDWLKDVPTAALIEQGFFDDADTASTRVKNVLAFFGVSSVDAWKNAWLNPCCQFRGKNVQNRKPGHVAAWLRMGELVSERVSCEPFSAKRFREVLGETRGLTTTPPRVWKSELQRRCATAGVAVVLIKEIAGASVSGVAKWLTKDRALIQLSLKYKTDDQFWFTFFHEAAHILLHGKRQVFVDDGAASDDVLEKEANQFSRDILIPPRFAGRLSFLKSKASIRAFAETIGIAPGIVVGRLQHEGILKSQFCNDLKVRLAWQAKPVSSKT